MSITTHQQAIDIASETQPTRVASYGGGRTRKNKYAIDGENVLVVMYQTVIAKFTPAGVIVQTGGYNTQTTLDGLNAALGIQHYPDGFRCEKFVALYRGEPMTEGMLIGYDGAVITHTQRTTPRRDER